MKSFLNIFKGKDGKDKCDKRRVQFDRKIQICKNSTPIKYQPPQKKTTSIFRDDMYIGKTAGYNTPGQPRTRKPLESCPGNIAPAPSAAPLPPLPPLPGINSSPSTNSEIAAEFDFDENEKDRQTSFSSENEIDYYSRYKHYKKLSKILSNQNRNLQVLLHHYEHQSTAIPDSEELQRLRNENSELRLRYNQLTIEIERALSYQKPTYLHYPPPSQQHQQHMDGRQLQHQPSYPIYSHHHLQQPTHGYPAFNLHQYPSSTTAFPHYSPTPPSRNFSANGQYEPSETDNTDQGEHEKNIFGNSIPKVADLNVRPPSPAISPKSDEDIC